MAPVFSATPDVATHAGVIDSDAIAGGTTLSARNGATNETWRGSRPDRPASPASAVVATIEPDEVHEGAQEGVWQTLMSDLVTRTATARERHPEESSEAETVSRPRDQAAILDEAIAALMNLARVDAPSPVDWARTARLLRHSARAQRASLPRVASVALVLSDALTFTDPASASQDAKKPLVEGGRLLLEPFVATTSEEALFESLLSAGWTVTASFDPAAYAALPDDHGV